MTNRLRGRSQQGGGTGGGRHLSGGGFAILTIAAERETHGRWIARVLALPGALANGAAEIGRVGTRLLWRVGWWPP